VRFAYQTHYVGDIRAGRTTILDTYLLKSLDTFDFNALDGEQRMLVLPCQGSRLCVWGVRSSDCMDEACAEGHFAGGQGLSYRLDMGAWPVGSQRARAARKILAPYASSEGDGWRIEPFPIDRDEDVPEMDDLPEEEVPKARAEARRLAERRRALGIDDRVFKGRFEELSASSSLLRARPELLDALLPFRIEGSGSNLRYPMDHIIRCFGWAMDTSIFDESVPVRTTHRGKYPDLNPDYEAVGVPGLYFAGTLSHGLDFRESAGGFIHGFRYTARALFRLLEQRNFGAAWPQELVPLRPSAEEPTGTGVNRLTALLQRRINEASGPYQMFQALGDVVLFERNEETGAWAARYLEEVPLKHALEEHRRLPRLSWVFRYGEGFHGPEVLGSVRVGSTSSFTAERSKFLHPMLSYHPAGSEEAARRHWLTEDVFTSWRAADVYSPLVRFVARVVAAATGDDRFLRAGAFSEDPGLVEECYGGPAASRAGAAYGETA